MSEGLLNFRAVESYPATGGRLRPNWLYRSGAFDKITEAGLDHMRALDVTRVFDLRSNGEKKRRPSPLVTQPGFDVFEEPHSIRSGDLRNVLASPASTAEGAADEMRSIYTLFPEKFAGVFATCFRALASGDRPFVIHCTAGKDRTGLAVALLLSVAGVARTDIFEDYGRTNAAAGALATRLTSGTDGLNYVIAHEALLPPVIAADESYLATAFDVIDGRFGGVEPYLTHLVGLSAAELATMRSRLVA